MQYTIAELIGEDLSTYDDFKVEEDPEPYLMSGEPDSLKQCLAWIGECRNAIEAIERKILHLRSGHRPLKADGRSLTQAEMASLKNHLFDRKRAFQDRYRWLKDWRKSKEEAIAANGDVAVDPVTAGVRCMKAATKRYVHLEELYEVVSALVELPDGEETDEDWDRVYAALDVLDRSLVVEIA